ncbi:hypothetical protein F4820DRAFT_430662 [Hypoxylon rubiginosum]|uniref:Uncharacterized protein n=1 Tax=Hypoxylon rubiginosum TaxID=110542 RepID=A0ACB9YTD6_9PEZI|nr:hypothetical protein F4820DRAFT_430662 [Hypoxylon rubiginosum]
MSAKVFTALLATASVISAAPFQPRALSSSKGFKLVARIVGPSKDLSVPIQGALLEGAHVGAGMSTTVLNATNPGVIFYQNGTAEEVQQGVSSILSDGGTPLFPFGLSAYLNSTDAASPVALAINGGIGTTGVTLTKPAGGRAGELEWGAASFIACDETLAYYGPSWRFAVVKDLVSPNVKSVIPDNCVQINLLPLCTTLPDLPSGSMSSHEFANEIACYESLSDIN